MVPWKTRESVELATLEWVSWFNRHRLLEPIGYMSRPACLYTARLNKLGLETCQA